MRDPRPADRPALSSIEEQEGDKLAALAQAEHVRPAGNTLQGLIAEAADTATDSDQIVQKINMAADEDAMAVAALLAGEVRGALLAGYETRLRGLAHLHNQQDSEFALLVEIEPDDVAALQAYPILGHPPSDWINRTAQQLAWDLQGIGVQADLGSVRNEGLPSLVMAAEDAHTKRVRGLITNAYLAGAQAGQLEWSAMLATP